jgi:DNA-binding transcriptional MerR regulator
LRLYEQRGLVVPGRNAGWRAYGPDEMARAGEIVALRALGSASLKWRVIAGKPQDLERAIAAHQGALERQQLQVSDKLSRVRALRTDLAAGRPPDAGALALLRTGKPAAAFELPWPWGGEWFELRELMPLSFIVGPLGSGKTRLAMRLAEELPNARFTARPRECGYCRSGIAATRRSGARMACRVRRHGFRSTHRPAGRTEADGPSVLVIDLVEQGLDHATQEALIGWLGPGEPTSGRYC